MLRKGYLTWRSPMLAVCIATFECEPSFTGMESPSLMRILTDAGTCEVCPAKRMSWHSGLSVKLGAICLPPRTVSGPLGTRSFWC